MTTVSATSPSPSARETIILPYRYVSMSVTKDYFEAIGSSECSFSSVAAKISLLVFPIMILLTLLGDMILALHHCLYGKKEVAIEVSNRVPSQSIRNAEANQARLESRRAEENSQLSAAIPRATAQSVRDYEANLAFIAARIAPERTPYLGASSSMPLFTDPYGTLQMESDSESDSISSDSSIGEATYSEGPSSIFRFSYVDTD